MSGTAGGHVTVLGPQRRPTLQRVAADLDAGASIAIVTAGWREREGEDEELRGLLGGRGVNLGLHGRWLDVLDHDPELAAALREHDTVLDELQQVYLVQLDAALTALYEVGRRGAGRSRVGAAAREDAERVVRLVDEAHLRRRGEVEEAFEAAWHPAHRLAAEGHVAAVEQVLRDADVLVVAGGHVGLLLRVLEVFGVARRLPGRVIAWSAGAMALTERVLLFHDYAPHGPSHPEFFAQGQAVIRDLVLLPHARRRLRTDDVARMSTLARRAAPARCAVLDDGVRVDLGPDGGLPAEACVVHLDGHIGALEPR